MEGERRAAAEAAPPPVCALCGRPLGAKVEWHHPVPKAEGGTVTVPVHPICHRAIHAALTNAELARQGGDMSDLAQHPALAKFLAWVADKPADFHAPTRRAKGRGEPSV
ncbi:HNH endonuclease [Sphingomonas sp. Y38-1Y]|uniref:HNH endonuclease signature motif containing protein n=1 Tax=Sphingomonas sp. Y38-1Y TaxID=3078265 RepID=UPI0028ECDFE7|nr:HNH endonuclease [Sphingomonas sp. Y38-1Y]